MIDFSVVDLSRLQFALTALYHFLFVPLTLGLSMILVIMESVYVITGREIWKQMTRFWGLLFGINFAMGVATGITMEFQFGTNWAYYSHYVGDVFGAPLAIEGLMAFFLESTFVGLFFFGWDRLPKVGHLLVTFLVALGSSFSALWILIANAWMQYPVGARFNFETMRMELTSFREVLLNPVAQSKFVHTVSAGYVVGSVFVLAISAWYLLGKRNRGFAQRSMAVAASFGLAAALSVVVLGDESGYTATEHQKMKLAAIEAAWETAAPPAPFTVFGLPDVAARKTHAEIQIPWALGLIATRSLDGKVLGINELVDRARLRIANGIEAHRALERLRANSHDDEARRAFEAHEDDLGYGLLLLRYVDDPAAASPAQIDAAAWSHRAQRTGALLELPRHGGLGTILHRALRDSLLLRRASQLRMAPGLSQARALEPAPAVDCSGSRVDYFGVRPPALGDRRRVADLSRRLTRVRDACRAHRSSALSSFIPCSPSSMDF